MTRAPLIVAAILITLLAVAAVGVYSYDSGRDGLIASGVTIGGVDVGGRTIEEARELLENDLAGPLRQPVKIKVVEEEFKLSAKDAKVHLDTEGQLREALEATREPGIFARVWRDISGSALDLSLDIDSTYSKKRVKKLVADIAADVERDPVDATVEPTSGGLDPVASSEGRALEERRLERQIGEQLVAASGKRRVNGELARVEPAVKTADLASEYPNYIVVDRDAFKLRFYRGLKLEKTYTIAVGQAGYDTPTGLYNIQDKQIDPVWYVPDREWAGKLAGTTVPSGAPNNPLKSRWMGIYNGAGIHGTSDIGSLGSAASHGCIRMAVPDVEELYEMVPVATPVYIG